MSGRQRCPQVAHATCPSAPISAANCSGEINSRRPTPRAIRTAVPGACPPSAVGQAAAPEALRARRRTGGGGGPLGKLLDVDGKALEAGDVEEPAISDRRERTYGQRRELIDEAFVDGVALANVVAGGSRNKRP